MNHLGGMGHRAVGAEMRGLSAIDIALWDIFGQSVGLPIYRLLGGPVRDRIQLYNTCSGYVGIGYAYGHAVSGPYEDDYDGWQQGRAAELAKSLLDMEITAMKIWPFDKFADRPFDHIEGRNWAQHITPSQIEEGLQPFRDIRDAVGLEMDIGVELHHRWSLPAAIRIAEALDPYQPMWYEDPMPADSADELAEFARRTNVPLMASESLASRYAYRELLERGAVGIVNIDPTWVGGITESRRVCNLAEAYHRPFAPHDCAGPLDYVVGVHLCIALTNAMIQEVCGRIGTGVGTRTSSPISRTSSGGTWRRSTVLDWGPDCNQNSWHAPILPCEHPSFDFWPEWVRVKFRRVRLKIVDLRTITLGGSKIVRIDTDEGIHGYGEANWGALGPVPNDFILALKPAIVGLDPTT